jgi:hypothetical protein
MAKREYIPSSVRFYVLQRDGFSCRYCRRGPADGSILELDHIVPHSKGGTDDADNLVTACQECNRGKLAKEGVKPPANGVQTMRAASPGLAGKCFVIFSDDRRANFTGIVRDRLTDTHYLVQFFDALMGEPSTLAIKTLGEMTAGCATRAKGTFEFFEDLEHLNYWLETYGKR